MFNRKDDKITVICIEIEMRFGQRGNICDNPMVLEQFPDSKSVQKRGENLDKNKDQEVRRRKMGDFCGLFNLMGDLFSLRGRLQAEISGLVGFLSVISA